jgi:hypothetical protein
MKEKFMKKFCCFICFLGIVFPMYGEQFLQISISPDVQLVGQDESVSGLRLNLPYGKNISFSGLDFGFLSSSAQDADALQVNLIGNLVEQNGMGAQVSCLNVVYNSMKGLQISLLFNDNYKFNGIGVAGGFNKYTDEGNGILIATCGNYGEVLKGVQVGLCNISTYSTGLQIGVFNYAKNVKGLQIGILNIIEEGALPFMPFLNFNF